MKGTVLERICARTRIDLDARKAATPLAALQARPVDPPLDAVAALSAPGLSLIAEYKPRSPSKGPIRPDAQPEDIARCYAPYAAAMSVLCDGPFFGGGYPLLARVRATVDFPLLAKDFVIDPYQIHEARAHGADLVLLMCSVLPKAQLADLLGLTRSLGMAALVETHDDAELQVALDVGARIIGVNSRDLRTLAIDLDQARDRLTRVPADRVRVAESGLTSREAVDSMRPHADAALIGSHLMGAPDPTAAIEALGFQAIR